MTDQVSLPCHNIERQCAAAKCHVASANSGLIPIVQDGKAALETAEAGHFRPIQRGFAMSGHPPEADIGTAGIYQYTP
jgi:hypothetical protein